MAALPESIVQWFASVPKDTCPGCKKPLPAGTHPRQRLCRRAKCSGRKKYLQLYSAAKNEELRGPSSLREVVRVTPMEDKPTWCNLLLSCGHTVPLLKSRLNTGKRRHCTTCGAAPAAAPSSTP